MQRDIALPDGLFDDIAASQGFVKHGKNVGRGIADIGGAFAQTQQTVYGGVQQCDRTLCVHCDDALGQTVDEALQPVALHFERGNGAAQFAGKVIERTP